MWRRFSVSGGISLSALHDRILQPVMGWSRGYHSHNFCDLRDGACFGPTERRFLDDMHREMHAYHFLEEQNYRLADIVSKPGDAFRYVYDLGDQFVHLVTLEEIVPGDNTFELIDGAFAGRPEDSCGFPGKGNMGYQQLLRLVKEKGADNSVVAAGRRCLQHQMLPA